MWNFQISSAGLLLVLARCICAIPSTTKYVYDTTTPATINTMKDEMDIGRNSRPWFRVEKFNESIYVAEREDLQMECKVVTNNSSEIGKKKD